MSAPFPVRPLSDLATSIDYGVTASASADDSGTKFLRITDIQDGTVDWQTVPFCEAAPNKLRSARLSDGDIVFARTGATTGKSFLIQSPPDGAVFASYLIRVRPSASVAPAYLAHFFQSTGYWSQIQRKTQGAAQGGVNATSLSEIEIPLPPLDEQRRIATILDKAAALRRKRMRTLELLNDLSQVIFTAMFGDLEINSSAWPILPFDAVVSIDAPLVDPKLEKYSHLLHYGPDRIEKDTGRLLPAQSAREDNLVSNKFLCNDRHILYSKIRPYLNKVALSEAECLCSADVYPVSVKASVANRVYLWFLLRSRAFLKYADTCSNRANIPKINREQFLAYQAPIPPLALQEQFARRIGLVEQSSLRTTASRSNIDHLFSALQHHAFAGELS